MEELNKLLIILQNCKEVDIRGAFAILLTFIKLQFVIKIFVLSYFEWPYYTGFTLPSNIVVSQSLNTVFLVPRPIKETFLLVH